MGLSHLALVLLLVTQTLAVRCTTADKAIFDRVGASWPRLFRSFAGLTVDKSTYERSIIDVTGLSHPCASCYGDAYLCGYEHCKWSCITEGPSCDACLREENCLQTCASCTGFPLL
jgi:hypothetical protein